MQFGEEFLLDFTFLGGLFQVSPGVTARIPSPDILRWLPNIHIDCPCPHRSSVDLSEKAEASWPKHCGETGSLMWEKISRTKMSDSKRHHHSFHGFSLFDASLLKLKTFLQEKRKTKTIWRKSAERLFHAKQRIKIFLEKFYNRKLRTNKAFGKIHHFISIGSTPWTLQGMSYPSDTWDISAAVVEKFSTAHSSAKDKKPRSMVHGAKWVLTK